MAAPRPLRLWLGVLAIAALPPLLAVWTDRPATPLPADAPPTEFSEARALPIVEELAGTIGHRLAGSEGARRGEAYLVARLREIPGLEVEVQEADRIYGRTRYRVRNVLARLAGDEAGSVLVSAHYDSAAGSVGAADDAVGVAAAVEVARALAAGPRLRQSVVFNLNEGEELGLFGSLAFLHEPWAQDVRAFVNLEAAGAGGRPMLFQADSEALVSAYGRGAPHPHGSVFAQDVFDSGLIPSDTDFRVYRHGGLPGLDLALYQDGWAYHTHLDRPERVERGSLQEMGANTLGFVRELAAGELAADHTPESPVFYDLLGLVLVRYSSGTALVLVVLSLVLLGFSLQAAVRRGRVTVRSLLIGCVMNVVVLTVAVLLPLALAWLVVGLLDRPFGWYPRPWLAVVAFGAPALGVILATHGVIAAPWSRAAEDGATGVSARPMLLAAQPVGWCIVLCVATLYGLGSAYVALWWALPGALALRLAATRPQRPLLALAIGYLPGALVTSQLATALITNFVPMAGRMSIGIPMDYAIAAMVALPAALCGLAAVPALHHVPSRLWRPAAAVFLGVGAVATGYLAVASPHTAERPQRVNLHVEENGAVGLRALDGLPISGGLDRFPTKLPLTTPPELQLIAREELTENVHRLTLRLLPRGATFAGVNFPGESRPRFEGEDDLDRGLVAWDPGFSFVAPPAEGLDFGVVVQASDSIEIGVWGQHLTLPPEVLEGLSGDVAVRPLVSVRTTVTLSLE